MYGSLSGHSFCVLFLLYVNNVIVPKVKENQTKMRNLLTLAVTVKISQGTEKLFTFICTQLSVSKLAGFKV